MDEYEEMIKEIREKEKIIKERLKEFDDRTSKTMTENEEMTLDEIVARLKKPGVFVKSVTVNETAERDMQEFGSKVFLPYETEEMKKFDKSEDYMFIIKLKYNNDEVELDVYNNTFTLKSKNPDLSFSDIYDSKKNELNEMFNNSKSNENKDINKEYKI